MTKAFETEEEENRRLTKEYHKRVQAIATKNYVFLMKTNFIPLARKIELAKTQLLKNDAELLNKARSYFIDAKNRGYLDEMNNWRDLSNAL